MCQKNSFPIQLYMSEDYGTNFADISSRFKLESGANAVIARYYHHPRSSCRYVFADTINQYIFTSSDCGKTVKGRKVQVRNAEYLFFGEKTYFLWYSTI